MTVMPQISIRPSGTCGQGTLSGFELEFQADRIERTRAFLQFNDHRGRQDTAGQYSMVRRLSGVVASADPCPMARLADQLAHRVQEPAYRQVPRCSFDRVDRELQRWKAPAGETATAQPLRLDE